MESSLCGLIAQPLEGDHAEWNAAIAELGFSKQQARLIQLILEGKGDKQIAAEMGVRFGTIRTYLSRAFERTGTSGRMELAALVFSRVMFHRQQAAEKRP